MIFIFLFLTSLCMTETLGLSTWIQMTQFCSFFYGWMILHCIYAPHLLYPFTCRWTSRLLPCPSYCKWCCSEHWGTCIFLVFSGLLEILSFSFAFRFMIHFELIFVNGVRCMLSTALFTVPSTSRCWIAYRNLECKIQVVKIIRFYPQ